MNKYIITPLLLCCLALPAMADTVELQDNHPERHVVVKGDTLWGISAKFLKDPWQWPKVWRMNREQIKNPHRIYPGDVVVLDMSSGDPQLRLLSENTVTLEPTVREEALEKAAIPTIQPNVISPFLTQPLVINNDELNSAPMIVSGPDNRLVLAPGTNIYVSRVDEGDGRQWHIYRPGKVLIDPDTKAVLGTEAVYLGDARVKKFGAPATVEVIRAKEEIFKQDRLVPAPDTLQNSFVPRAPFNEVTGRILTVHGGVAEVGANSIVSINLGTADGMEEGHVLAIKRTGKLVQMPSGNRREYKPYRWPENKNKPYDWSTGAYVTSTETPESAKKAGEKLDPSLIKLPNERIGLLMIFRTFERVSYALVMQASDPINVLDMVETP
jgi:hypothetical protein